MAHSPSCRHYVEPVKKTARKKAAKPKKPEEAPEDEKLHSD